VLVTAVGGNVGQGVLKSLRAARRKFHVVGIDMEPLSAGFALADDFYPVPSCGAADFAAALGRIVRSEGIEAVYVCSPAELDFFSSHKEELEASLGAVVLVNPRPVVAIGSDKLRTAEFLRDAGLPFLHTALAEDGQRLDELIGRCGFPLIGKPRCGSASRNVFRLHSRKEIEAARVLVPDLVVQQFVPDESGEYTAATLSGQDGRVRASIILRRDLLQGTTYRTELAQGGNLDTQVRRVVEALGAVGACNVQFRMVGETALVFEINPRFSGTTGIRHLYGFNDSEMAFELFRLGLEVCQPDLRPAVVLRYWNEVCVPGASFASLRQPGAAQFGHAWDGWEERIIA
jgi:carbamoyl-phosphate synthase large subunit